MFAPGLCSDILDSCGRRPRRAHRPRDTTLTRRATPEVKGPLDPEAFEGLAGVRLALRHFLAASEKISRAAGITQQQYQALLAVKTGPQSGMSMKDLAEQLLVTHHAGVQLVDRLSLLGLAERRPSTSDRRSVIVSLTPAGAEIIEGLASQHLQEMLRHEPLLAASLRRLRRLGARAAAGPDDR